MLQQIVLLVKFLPIWTRILNFQKFLEWFFGAGLPTCVITFLTPEILAAIAIKECHPKGKDRIAVGLYSLDKI